MATTIEKKDTDIIAHIIAERLYTTLTEDGLGRKIRIEEIIREELNNWIAEYEATNTEGFVALEVVPQMMEKYAQQECIAVLDSIRTYHQENGNTGFAYDNRTSGELYQIYIDSKTKQI